MLIMETTNVFIIFDYIFTYFYVLFCISGDNNSLSNYFQSISDHKDVIRSSMSVQGLILMMRDDVTKIGNVSLFFCFKYNRDTRKTLCIFTLISMLY